MWVIFDLNSPRHHHLHCPQRIDSPEKWPFNKPTIITSILRWPYNSFVSPFMFVVVQDPLINIELTRMYVTVKWSNEPVNERIRGYRFATKLQRRRRLLLLLEQWSCTITTIIMQYTHISEPINPRRRSEVPSNTTSTTFHLTPASTILYWAIVH